MPAEGPQIPIRVAASRLLHWAHSHSLLRPEAYFPEGDDTDLPEFDHEPGLTAISTLRQKQIRFVGVNTAAGEMTVFLHRAAPSARAIAALPKTCEGYRLRYRQGNPEPVSPSNIAEANITCAIHVAANGNNVYTCGSSISVGNARAAGTLGCLLRNAAGQLFGLSNNHVTASCNYAPVGLPVVAPGILDVSPTNPPPFTLGFHRAQLPMQMGDPTIVNATANHDAAIFELMGNAPVSSMQQNHYDTPTSSVDLVPGMDVQKVGRTSELTAGKVLAEIVGAN